MLIFMILAISIAIQLIRIVGDHFIIIEKIAIAFITHHNNT